VAALTLIDLRSNIQGLALLLAWIGVQVWAHANLALCKSVRRSSAMAATCDVCKKGPSFGNNVSHSQVKTRRRWNPNIQRVRTLVGGTPKRQNVCTSCLKAGKVTR
jgi:large subunit ribosomal protein L28